MERAKRKHGAEEAKKYEKGGGEEKAVQSGQAANEERFSSVVVGFGPNAVLVGVRRNNMERAKRKHGAEEAKKYEKGGGEEKAVQSGQGTKKKNGETGGG
ncbi:hypothetical protein CBOM_02642 [Ceraceosorus bombacis]|uniref:Uncharacterized protein n=1 Tax=Ceraceosorus bombacis TaxID=401625 RepID=A0A0P1BF86_9BASI|nr:hypothetical protein CBOM_02642 [Ceraceosorus bombacis]